jgi:gamma-tubulin complex component 2
MKAQLCEPEAAPAPGGASGSAAPPPAAAAAAVAAPPARPTVIVPPLPPLPSAAAAAAASAAASAGGALSPRAMTRREQLLEALASDPSPSPATRHARRASGASESAYSDDTESEPPTPSFTSTPPRTGSNASLGGLLDGGGSGAFAAAAAPGAGAGAASGLPFRSVHNNQSYLLPDSPATPSEGASGVAVVPIAAAAAAAAAQPWDAAAAAAAPQEPEPQPLLMLPTLALGLPSGPSSRRAAAPPSGPPLPEWVTRRPFLTGEHLGAPPRLGAPPPRPPAAGRKPLRAYPPHVQELLILDDILYAMVGIDGRFVRAACATPGGAVRFALDADADASLAELAGRLLPLCDDAAAVARFVESRSRYEHGLTAHATAAALRALLRDWRALAAQLEHQLRTGRLSLQAAWFYCQPAAGALRLLAAAAGAAVAAGARGAALLNALQRAAAAHAGDAAAAALLQQLLAAAAAPYCAALGRWVYEGVVDDPYAEFLIQEATHLSKESLSEEYTTAYWSERYTLRGEPPLFLSPATAQRCVRSPACVRAPIRHSLTHARASPVPPRLCPLRSVLTTGKYLNAIRECGAPVVCPFAAGAPIEYDPSAPSRHTERIEAAFAFASRELLALLFGPHALGARLKCLKHSFLLDQGDFLVHFLDTAGEELAKPAAEIGIPKLQSLLELALRLSIAAADAHTDDLQCGLERSGIIAQLLSIYAVSEDDGGAAAGGGGHEDGGGGAGGGGAATERVLTGMETFTLDYKVSWPLSLVISRRALTKYQLVFRHLFHCKHVERQLAATWQLHQATRRVSGMGGRLGRAYCLCQRMLHFLQNFMYYMTVEVIEPNWATMDAAIRDARTLDDVIDAHDRFLDACMKEGMLFWPKILKRLERIKSICLRFAATTAVLSASLPTSSGSTPPPSPGAAHLRASGALSPGPGGAPFGLGAGAAPGFGRKSRAAAAEEAAAINAAASEPGFAAAMRALEAQFDTQLRELMAALNASSHLEPNLASLCARLGKTGE